MIRSHSDGLQHSWWPRDHFAPFYHSPFTYASELELKLFYFTCAISGLKGRICEFNLADMNGQPEDGYKKIALEVQEIQGKTCLTDFHGELFD